MGRSLGILWAEQGHEVFFGGRTAKKGKDVQTLRTGHQGGTNDEAAALLKCCYTQCEG